MSNHTPGPWEIVPADHDNSFIRPVGRKAVICETYTYLGDDNFERANAKLIAAAPALLELVTQYAHECGDCQGTRICPDGERCDMCDDIHDACKAVGITLAKPTYYRDPEQEVEVSQ